MLLQLLVDFSSELRRQIDSTAVLRGLAEDRSFPLQGFQSLPQIRDLIRRETAEEVILEHVVLPEHPMAVELVQDRGLIPGNVPQAGRNRGRKYK